MRAKARRTWGMVMEPPDDQRHIERVDHFLALPTLFAAAHQVIGDAVVAAQHRRGHQAEELFVFGAERARLVGLMIQREKSFDAEMAAAENFFVQVGAEFLEIIEAVSHGSSVFSRSSTL